MSVAAAIPWKVIVQALPAIVVTARQLQEQWSSRPRTRPVDAKADTGTQLASIMERVAALEDAETVQSKLVSEMAVQLQAVARRAAIAYWPGLGGLALSCITLMLMASR